MREVLTDVNLGPHVSRARRDCGLATRSCFVAVIRGDIAALNFPPRRSLVVQQTLVASRRFENSAPPRGFIDRASTFNRAGRPGTENFLRNRISIDLSMRP